MDYYCPNCKSCFEEPSNITDYVTDDPVPIGPTIQVCPHCGSDDWLEAIECTGCGKYIIGEYIKTRFDECYCENCYTKHDTSDI